MKTHKVIRWFTFLILCLTLYIFYIFICSWFPLENTHWYIHSHIIDWDQKLPHYFVGLTPEESQIRFNLG